MVFPQASECVSEMVYNYKPSCLERVTELGFIVSWGVDSETVPIQTVCLLDMSLNFSDPVAIKDFLGIGVSRHQIYYKNVIQSSN